MHPSPVLPVSSFRGDFADSAFTQRKTVANLAIEVDLVLIADLIWPGYRLDKLAGLGTRNALPRLSCNPPRLQNSSGAAALTGGFRGASLLAFLSYGHVTPSLRMSAKCRKARPGASLDSPGCKNFRGG